MSMTPGGRPLALGPGAIPGLSGLMGPSDQMARALMAAIIEAAKGSCTCTVCRLMRKVQEGMTAEVLEEGAGEQR